MQGRLFRSSSRSIQSLSVSRSEQKAFYLFLRSNKTTEAKLIKEITQRCSRNVKGRVVLAIQDTSEVNLSSHRNRIKADSGLGDIDDNKGGIGFKIHPSLVVDAGSCFPLGFSDISIWNRAVDMADKHERKYNQLPIEQKESYKWIASGNKTKQCLEEAEAVIIVQDREGDIFEQFFQIPDEKTFLLIRSRSNRTTVTEDKLWDVLGQSELTGQYETQIPADNHSKAPARNATMEVRCVCVEIKAPQYDKRNKEQTVTLYAVEAKEVNSETKEPVHWRLLTTWPVNNYEQALTIIEWYSWRWFIEELFRVLKKEGFHIEGSELESGWAIRKLTVLLLDTIVKLMQMHIAYNEPEQANVPDTNLVFNEQEQHCLEAIGKGLEGKTKALQNPYPNKKLNNAVWIIARIGGWKGYKSQRPPGMTTLFNGLRKFYDVFIGWSLEKDVGTR